MNKVEVIEPTRKTIQSRRRGRDSGLLIERIRVAAYCRVSTDEDDQLGSFDSQKQYYDEKIKSNPEWVNVGIFADEAISGTKVKKRDDFIAMIQKCMDGQIDLILTKSISRFARNTLDTLQYVRMLKDRNVAVYFEKENINTLEMNGELLLTILSSLAQQEVESLSQNVKLGLKMKMKRGELCGFHGCFGYDYDFKEKTLSINEPEAEIVRMIFDMYLQGYGCTTIAKHLTKLGIKNRRGISKWHEGGVKYIIENEKYTGDIILGKTFTVDPISKRRLKNLGEEEQYYIRNHHEAIISREVWQEANRIRQKRGQEIPVSITENRGQYTRKYALSSVCECGYCGTKLIRRVVHSGTKHEKIVWHCKEYVKNGVSSCSKCKAIDEKVIHNAFVEAFNLLAGNLGDVTEIVIQSLEDTLLDNGSEAKLKNLEREKANLLRKKDRITDMLLDGVLSKEDSEEKFIQVKKKLSVIDEKKNYLENEISEKKHVKKKIKEVRKLIEEHTKLEFFDRGIFDSIIDRIIVGGCNEDGSLDPYKLTFVMKGKQSAIMSNAKNQVKSKQYHFT